MGELRGDLDPEIASFVFIGGLEIVLTGPVLGVIEVGDPEGEGEYYPRVAKSVVDIFSNGVRAPDVQ